MHNAVCLAAHMGLWCIDDRWFRQAIDAIRLGMAVKAQPEHWDSAAMYGLDSRGEALRWRPGDYSARGPGDQGRLVEI